MILPGQHTENKVHDEKVTKYNQRHEINPHPCVTLHISYLKKENGNSNIHFCRDVA